jgi:1,4-alpha-glucan branching enzyme
MIEDLGRLYRQSRCLWQGDPDPSSFYWIDCDDWEQSILCYARRYEEQTLIVVLNLTPVPRDRYRIGAPRAGAYRQVLCTDDPAYGGSGYPTTAAVHSEPVPMHRREQSLLLSLPPLSALLLSPST